MTKEETLAFIKKAALEGRLGARQTGTAHCRYSAGDQRCAVGVLLTDEELQKIDEDGQSEVSKVILTRLHINPMERWGLSGISVTRLQIMHDSNTYQSGLNVERFLEELATL